MNDIHKKIDTHIRHQFKKIQDGVKKVVEEKGDPSMSDFYKAIDEDNGMIKEIVKALVQDSVLRMKEDSTEHDWTYRKGRRFAL